jgi:hypothetical protein
MVTRSTAGACPVCSKVIKKGESSVPCSLSCGKKVHQICLEQGADEGSEGEPPPATWTCKTCLRPTNQHGANIENGLVALIASLERSNAKKLEMALELGEVKAKNISLEAENAELKQLIQKSQNIGHFPHVSSAPRSVAKSPAHQPILAQVLATTSPRPPPDRGGEVPDYAAVAAGVAAKVVNKEGSGKLRAQLAPNQNKTTRPSTKAISTSDIYVASKDSKSNDAAVSLVKKHLHTVPDIMDHIEEVVPLKMHNTVVIKCTNAESRKLVKDTLEKAIGESHKIEHSRKPRREIKVHDIAFDETFPPKLEDGTVDKDAILCDIIAKNKLPEDGFISVKSVGLIAKGNPKSNGRISLLVDEKTKEAILGGNGLKVGWSRCRRLEEVCPILQCYKCRGYNHTQTSCWLNKETPEKNICSICTEDHRPKDCPSKKERENFKCINCVNHNKKQVTLSEPNILEHNHRADDHYNCPIYAHVCKNYEARMARD